MPVDLCGNVFADRAAGLLTPDYTTTPCPGDLISLTCTAPGLDTIWNIPGRDIAVSPLNTEPLIRDPYTVEVITVDETGNMLTSRLSTPTVDGLSIGCTGLQGSVGTVVIQTVGKLTNQYNAGNINFVCLFVQIHRFQLLTQGTPFSAE